jgi:hypothetical protein
MHCMVRVMVFNATFNNISVISWQLVLLGKESGIPGKTTDLPQVTDKLHCMVTCYKYNRMTVVRSVKFSV